MFFFASWYDVKLYQEGAGEMVQGEGVPSAAGVSCSPQRSGGPPLCE